MVVDEVKLYGQVKGRKYHSTQPEPGLKKSEKGMPTRSYEHRQADSQGRLWCPSCHTYKDPEYFLKSNGRKCVRCLDCRTYDNEYRRKYKK